MKKAKDGWFQLELPEIIRVNQLIREKIDLESFTSWYEVLSLAEQLALIGCLIHFAWQAGVDDSVWSEASSAISKDRSSLVEKANSFLRKPHLLDLDSFDNWVNQLSESDRFTVFTFSVYLFGIAEGKVYRNEDKEWCNHWWHQDLFNEHVVKDLLNDPKFYMTSMKDDERIKDTSKWKWLLGK